MDRMANTGVYQIDRELWDHPFFKKEPYTEAQAWAWLIGQAEWRKSTVPLGRFTFELERGQAALSLRFVAAKWLWHKNKVDRYIQRATKQDMLRASIVNGMTVLTICNYERYQFGRDTQNDCPGTVNGTDIGTTDRDNRVLLEESLRQERKERQEGGRVAQNGSDQAQPKAAPIPAPKALLGPAPPPDPWAALKTRVLDIVAEATGYKAEIGIIDAWKANGYEPDLVWATIGEPLKAEPTKPLKYWKDPVKRAHDEAWETRKRAVAPPPPRKMDWEGHILMFRRLGEWPMALGPTPGSAGCRVPHEMQVSFGFLPAPARERVSA